MTKMFGPQGMREIAINSKRGKQIIRAGKDGMFDVTDNPALAKKLKDEGLGVASLSGTAASGSGFPCKSCGFGSWFKKCSRCGEING